MAEEAKLEFWDTNEKKYKDITLSIVPPGITAFEYAIDNKMQGNTIFLEVTLFLDCPDYGIGKYKLTIGNDYILFGAPGDGIKPDLINGTVTITLVDYLFYLLERKNPLKIGAVDAGSLSGEGITLNTIEDIRAMYELSEGGEEIPSKENVKIDGFSSRDGEVFHDGLGNNINIIAKNIKYKSKGVISGKGKKGDFGQCYVNLYDILKEIIEEENLELFLIHEYPETSFYRSVNTSGIGNSRKVWDCKVVNGFLIQLSSANGAVGLVSWGLTAGAVLLDSFRIESRDWDEESNGEDFLAYQIFPDYRNNCVYIPGWYCPDYDHEKSSNQYLFRVIKVSIEDDGTFTEEYDDIYSAIDIPGRSGLQSNRVEYRNREWRFPGIYGGIESLCGFSRMTWYTDDNLAALGKYRIIILDTGWDKLRIIDPDRHNAGQSFWKHEEGVNILSNLLVPDWMNGSVINVIIPFGEEDWKQKIFSVNQEILTGAYLVAGEAGIIHADDSPGNNIRPPLAKWRQSLTYSNMIEGESAIFHQHLSQTPCGVLTREGIWNNYTEKKSSFFSNNYDHDVEHGGSAWDETEDRVLVWSTDVDEEPNALRWDVHENYCYRRIYLYQPQIYSDRKTQFIDALATAGLFYEQKNGQIRLSRIRGVGSNIGTIQNSDLINIRDLQEFTNFADEYSIRVLSRELTKGSGDTVNTIKTIMNEYGFTSKLHADRFSDWTEQLQRSFIGKEFSLEIDNFNSIANTKLPNLADILTYDSNNYVITKIVRDLIGRYISVEAIKPGSMITISGLWVAGGGGTSTLAYSADGINWTGLGKNIFDDYGWGVCYNGDIWVAVGEGSTNTIAYSADGINWTGLGTSIFSTYVLGIAWNGSMWIAGGGVTNTLAYSYDGINWTGLGKSIFSSYGRGIAWNGSMWVAGGNGTNTLAYSADGINWTGLGTDIFSTYGFCIAWNGLMWAAGGGGTNTLAYSYDGINWTGLGTDIFSTYGRGIAWNGSMWVAGGKDINTLAYSYDGINWTGLGTDIFSIGLGVASKPAPQLYPPVN